ncbi:response regulator [Pleionea sp. CnH1-48]|uniref:response regulator n=1 Tax=Pleionea sp. CnH1-48 TaxID=2954494 RepID=UPI002098468F|nr:response regulator [Pleionea sp. CnH1-48]MCO7224888.1 response regulator [Pleionea sp. CnH1-48]
MTQFRILIVDDSEADQFISSALIHRYDPAIEILQAYDGQEALDILAQTSPLPNLILLDINMPRMNGFEFLQCFVLDFAGFEGHVVMLTSSEHKEDKAKAMDYPVVTEYLVKPLVSAMVKEIIER